MIQTFFSRKFVSFLLVGGTAASVNFGSRIFYNQWVDFKTAVVLAFINGLVTAFILNKLFVFKNSDHSMRRSAVYFFIVNLAALVQIWAVTMTLAYWLLPALGLKVFVQELAHAVGIAVPAFSSFLLHNHWTFKSSATLDVYPDETL